MSILEKLIADLSAFPALKLGRLGNRLEIETGDPDGFPVSIVEGKAGFMVSLGPCRWRFKDGQEAIDHVLFGLSDRCRLREVSRGRPYQWTIEQLSDKGWSAINETRSLIFPYWNRRVERVYRNTAITWR